MFSSWYPITLHRQIRPIRKLMDKDPVREGERPRWLWEVNCPFLSGLTLGWADRKDFQDPLWRTTSFDLCTIILSQFIQHYICFLYLNVFLPSKFFCPNTVTQTYYQIILESEIKIWIIHTTYVFHFYLNRLIKNK